MATVPFSKFLIEVGDGANPEIFSAPCGLTSKSLNRTASAVETPNPDCDDEDLPAEILRGIASVDWNIAGSVTLHSEDMDLYDNWIGNGETRNVRITLDLPLADKGRSYTAPAVLTAFNVKVDKGGKAATGDITISGSGKLTPVPAAA